MAISKKVTYNGDTIVKTFINKLISFPCAYIYVKKVYIYKYVVIYKSTIA